jgi:hypothetical protein
MATRIWEQSRVQWLNSWELNLKKKKARKWKYGMGTRYTQCKPMMLSLFSVNTPKKTKDEPSRTFKLPPKIFHVTVKFPLGTSNKFLNSEISRILVFPVNNDLATTGHKLQGMTKKFLIVSSINYNTANQIYVVLSRVTSLDGLYLMHPLKPNFNPRPTKLLQQEWIVQSDLEKETLLHLQKIGNFPVEIDLTTTDAAQSTDVNGEKSKNRISLSILKSSKKQRKDIFNY